MKNNTAIKSLRFEPDPEPDPDLDPDPDTPLDSTRLCPSVQEVLTMLSWFPNMEDLKLRGIRNVKDNNISPNIDPFPNLPKDPTTTEVLIPTKDLPLKQLFIYQRGDSNMVPYPHFCVIFPTCENSGSTT